MASVGGARSALAYLPSKLAIVGGAAAYSSISDHPFGLGGVLGLTSGPPELALLLVPVLGLSHDRERLRVLPLDSLVCLWRLPPLFRSGVKRLRPPSGAWGLTLLSLSEAAGVPTAYTFQGKDKVVDFEPFLFVSITIF